MNAPRQTSGAANNPLLQALSLIVAATLLGVAFVMGAVVIALLLAVGAAIALTVAVRIWWLHRRLSRTAAGDASDPSAPQVIEGEYTVVGEADAKRGRRSSRP